MKRVQRIRLRILWACFVAGSTLVLSACGQQVERSPRSTIEPANETQASWDRDEEGGTVAPAQQAGKRSASPQGTSTPLIPTPSPLPQSVLSSCPVSRPNLAESPDQDYISAEGGYGNPERTMFIELWEDGIVYFCTGCAGDLSPDGSLGMKFWFYRTVPGEVVFQGRRLDEPAPVAHLATLRGPADGYGETGFHPAGLVFPGQGCWEVTARIGDHRLTVVTSVVWIPFHPLWPGWLPQGMLHEDTNLSAYPDTFGLVFRSSNGGRVSVETSRLAWEATGLQEPVIVHGEPGICLQENGRGAMSGALLWSSAGIHYRIRYDDLEWTCRDVMRIAEPPGNEP